MGEILPLRSDSNSSGWISRFGESGLNPSRDLITDSAELFLAVFLRASGLRGIVETPVQVLGVPGEDRAVLVGVITHGNYAVPCLPEQSVNRL